MTMGSTRNDRGAGNEDPTVKVARISRTGAIVTAVIAALASIVTAYFTGRQQGKDSTPATTVVTTVTVPVPADQAEVSGLPATQSGTSTSSSPAGAAAPGEVHLGDRDPVEGKVQVGKATVRHQERAKALSVPNLCFSGEAFAYNIDPGMRSFHATVGLTDNSPSTTVEFTVFVDGDRKGQASVRVGQTADLDADVSTGFRLTLHAKDPYCTSSTGVFIDPVLRP